MLTRYRLLATFLSASVLFAAGPAFGDRTSAGVQTLTVAEARALGYNDWTPAEDARGVVLYAKTERVDRADLDLANPAQVAQLEKRIRAAALKACKAIGEAHSLAMPRTRACVQEATGRAMAKLRVRTSAGEELASVR